MPLSIIPNEGLEGSNCYHEEPAGRAKVALADGREIIVMYDKHPKGYHSRNYKYTERPSMFILDPERLPKGVCEAADKIARQIIRFADETDDYLFKDYTDYVAWIRHEGHDPVQYIVNVLTSDIAVYTDSPYQDNAPWYLLPMNTGKPLTAVFSQLHAPFITHRNQYGVGTTFLGESYSWGDETWVSGSEVRDIELQTVEQADETYRKQMERTTPHLY